MKNINLLSIFLMFLVSCAGFNEAGKVLRNEKTITTDEFLVKKKEPLIMPPNLHEEPKPKKAKQKKKKKEKNIKKIKKIQK